MADKVIDSAGPLLTETLYGLSQSVSSKQLGYIAGAILYEVTETIVFSMVLPVVGGALRGSLASSKIMAKLATKYPKLAKVSKFLTEVATTGSAAKKLEHGTATLGDGVYVASRITETVADGTVDVSRAAGKLKQKLPGPRKEVSQARYLEYKALRAQGLSASEAHGLMRQFDVPNRGLLRVRTADAVSEVERYTAWQIAAAIADDPVAYRSYMQLRNRVGADVVLDFGEPAVDALGRVRRIDEIEIFVRNNPTVRDAVSTFVHESRHISDLNRGIVNPLRPTVLDEYRAFRREFLFEHGRRPNSMEHLNLWMRARELYPHLPLE